MRYGYATTPLVDRNYPIAEHPPSTTNRMSFELNTRTTAGGRQQKRSDIDGVMPAGRSRPRPMARAPARRGVPA